MDYWLYSLQLNSNAFQCYQSHFSEDIYTWLTCSRDLSCHFSVLLMNEVETNHSLKLLMFEQNGWLVLSIRTHNPPSPLLPTLEVESRIPSLGPEIWEKRERKEIHISKTTLIELRTIYKRYSERHIRCIISMQKVNDSWSNNVFQEIIDWSECNKHVH